MKSAFSTKTLLIGCTLTAALFAVMWLSLDAANLSFNANAIVAHADDYGSFSGDNSYGDSGSSPYGSFSGDNYYGDSNSSSDYYDTTDTVDTYDYYDYYSSGYSNDYYYSAPSYTSSYGNYNYNYNNNYSTPPPNPTCTLSATPSSLNGSGDTTLYWDSSNATSGSIDNGIGSLIGAAGHITEHLSQTTTFNGTFYNSSGASVHCSTTVTVTPPPAAPTCTLDASPSAINSGGSSTLSWTTANATSASIDQSVGTVSPVAGGSTSVHPSGTTIYTLTATGAGGTKTCTTTVTVTPPPPPPGNGCIQVLKETFDPNSNTLTPVAQFSFTLDGVTTIQNDANGHATFTNVTPNMTHTVTETDAGPTWSLLSVTPANGQIYVTPGPTCVAIVFKNKQVVTPPTNGCIAVHKQTLDPNGNNLTPIAQFSFQLDGATTTQNDANGNATFSNVTPGTHTVTELSAGSTWNLKSVSVPSGQVTVQSGSSCAPVTFVNQQVVTSNPQPSCTLTATPNSFFAPSSTTLTWTSAHATSATIDNGVGSVSPVSGGSVSSPSISASTMFTMTVTGPGGTQTCQAPVTINTPGPACALFLSASSIHTGDSVVLSWTSANVSSGSIDNNVGTASPVSGGSTTVYPPSSTMYTGTFTGPDGTVTCSVPITVSGGGCAVGGCGGGGGGLDQPNVALYQQPNEQPLAFVSLSQIPYTGFEAGPALTMIFWLSIALLSALIAYAIVGKGATHYVLAYVLGTAAGVPIHEGSDAPEEDVQNGYGRAYPMDASVMAMASPAVVSAPVAPPRAPIALAGQAAPARTYVLGSSPVAPVPTIIDVIESRAHAAGVLMSPEAAALAAGLSAERAETLRVFGDILNDAVRTIPREDGWIMLTADTLRELSVKHPVAPVPATVGADVPGNLSLASIDESAASAFAGAVASGDRESAFSIVRSLEHDGVKPTALMTATATVLDALYRARHDSRPAPDLALADKASHLSDEQLENLVTVFTHALDHVYASPFTGVKLALAQAFEVIG
jgi:hypothetical protein